MVLLNLFVAATETASDVAVGCWLLLTKPESSIIKDVCSAADGVVGVFFFLNVAYFVY